MSTVRGCIRRLVVLGAALVTLGAVSASPALAAPEDYDFAAVEASVSTTQAGAHPDVSVGFELAVDPTSNENGGLLEPYGRTRNLTIGLPPGMVGNPTPVPTCSMEEFVNYSCPVESQVGVVDLGVYSLGKFKEPLYVLDPPSESAPARFGFIALIYPMTFNAEVRSEDDFGIDSTLTSLPGLAMVVKSKTTIWGVPADPIHDSERFTPQDTVFCSGPCGEPIASGLPPLPFMSNPTSCTGPTKVQFEAASYRMPNRVVSASASLPPTTGCDAVTFEPTMSAAPTNTRADSASGLDVTVEVPQSGLRNPDGLASAHVRKIVTTLPEGMAINPAAADGLGSCSPAEVGLISRAPIRFADRSPGCPASSKVAEATIDTPLLADPLRGGLYVAKQGDNPFDSLLAGYLVVKGSGVTIKLAGRFDLDPASGRIITTFDDNPQQPFSRLRLNFKGGNRGVLVTPPRCGTYEISSRIVPWSADPGGAGQDGTVVANSGFGIGAAADGGPCPAGTRPFGPGLSAGLVSPVAGGSSPFVLRVTRADGQQELDTIEVRNPEGLLASLAVVGTCPDAAAASGACPDSSRVGTVTAGVGAGLSPYYVRDGDAFLAGPYKGAPLSFVFTVPAKAGPFDLGTVVVRAAAHVDPVTARVTAIADPLPRILQGIPVHARDIRVALDRPGFMRAPTDCSQRSVETTLRGVEGAVASPSVRFQVGECAALGFKPRLKLRLKGAHRRSGHPALTAVLTMPRKAPGANIARASVALPHSEFLAQSHIRTICTRVQYAAGAGGGASCPKGAVYGRATAWSPLLDRPLSGPVYLRSSDNPLPDLVASLDGQIHLDLVGRIDSRKGGIRTTFAQVPDAQVSRFVLKMPGGRKSLLENSADICKGRRAATVKMSAQNGKVRTFSQRLNVTGCKKAKKRRGGHGR